MLLREWDDLPENMRNESVRSYYEALYEKRFSLLAKRIFDTIVAIITLIILSPALFVISIAIKLDSQGPVIFRQVRVTQYGKQFRIFKFRTMVNNADRLGAQVTTKDDVRVTKIGKILRKFRLDEFPQLINIILGDMSFVGTRPEVVKYAERYTDEMRATLLLPAGVTSEASIQYKDEEKLLENAEDADEMYLKYILPAKMKHNLKSLEEFSLINEIGTMIMTLAAICKKGKSVSNNINNETGNMPM